MRAVPLTPRRRRLIHDAWLPQANPGPARPATTIPFPSTANFRLSCAILALSRRRRLTRNGTFPSPKQPQDGAYPPPRKPESPTGAPQHGSSTPDTKMTTSPASSGFSVQQLWALGASPETLTRPPAIRVLLLVAAPHRCTRSCPAPLVLPARLQLRWPAGIDGSRRSEQPTPARVGPRRSSRASRA